MKTATAPKPTVAEISAELRCLQRQRAILIKSRNMQASRIQSIVAGTLGYASNMSEKDRKKKYAEASAVIEEVLEDKTADPVGGSIIKTTFIGIRAFEKLQTETELPMRQLAGELPVAKWVAAPNQRGFGLLFLAIVIGETGDLCNYAGPAKVWKRLGCAPHSYDDKTLMPSTWGKGKEGRLPAEEWVKCGYSPRRRSIAYLIGDGIVKQNRGTYRDRYDFSKALIKEAHPEYSDLRAHRHGMLLATKLLLKNLWLEWNGHPARGAL